MTSTTLPITYVRWKPGEDRVTRTVPSLAPDHPMADMPCIGCNLALGTDEPVSILVLGPGARTEAQERAREGRWGTFTAIAMHAVCAGAEVSGG